MSAFLHDNMASALKNKRKSLILECRYYVGIASVRALTLGNGVEIDAISNVKFDANFGKKLAWGRGGKRALEPL
ncbi:MAG: hypothetical protein GKR98_02115 [Boseongicola sp.]|nr:MAG: hypothetical protein GKR98_02115 [Boseongicola sp.]